MILCTYECNVDWHLFTNIRGTFVPVIKTSYHAIMPLLFKVHFCFLNASHSWAFGENQNNQISESVDRKMCSLRRKSSPDISNDLQKNVSQTHYSSEIAVKVGLSNNTSR